MRILQVRQRRIYDICTLSLCFEMSSWRSYFLLLLSIAHFTLWFSKFRNVTSTETNWSLLTPHLFEFKLGTLPCSVVFCPFNCSRLEQIALTIEFCKCFGQLFWKVCVNCLWANAFWGRSLKVGWTPNYFWTCRLALLSDFNGSGSWCSILWLLNKVFEHFLKLTKKHQASFFRPFEFIGMFYTDWLIASFFALFSLGACRDFYWICTRWFLCCISAPLSRPFLGC